MTSVFTLMLALIGTQAIKVELSEEKTPYDYVKERLEAIGTEPKYGLPLSSSYEVEESVDYPEEIKGAASNVLNTVAGVGGIGLGQGIGLGGINGLGGIGIGQGLGAGYGIGLGGLGVGAGGGLGGIGVNGLGGVGTLGIGAGGVGLANGVGLGNGVGLVNQGLGGIGVGGIGLGNGLLYHHPLLGAQVGGGYVDKNAYDAAQKKGADENVEKIEKKAGEEAKHGQEGFQQAAAAAKAEKGESSFYKDEEAKKKAAGDEKFYQGGQKVDKQGVLILFCLPMLSYNFGKLLYSRNVYKKKYITKVYFVSF